VGYSSFSIGKIMNRRYNGFNDGLHASSGVGGEDPYWEFEEQLLGGVIKPNDIMSNLKIGRMVEFFPNKNKDGLKLLNSMESAPAMIVQIFNEHVNLVVFTADNTGENPVKNAWSIRHKNKVQGEGESYWDSII
jgi:hypothetical protein